MNLELKPSDSSANPYLALGAFIHAGLDGLAREIDPGEPVNVDPAALSDSGRLSLRVHRLPQTLAAALDALEADDERPGPAARHRLPGGQALGSGGVRGPRRRLGVLPALHEVLGTPAPPRSPPGDHAPRTRMPGGRQP
ncbi:MAG: hypothetical protein ACRDNZ_09280 [Streptosporangiaceae bacterium]